MQTFFKGLDSETIRRIAEYSPAEFVAEVTRLKREQEIQVSAFERFMGIGRGGRRGGRGGPGFGRGNEPPPRGGRGQRSDGRGVDGNRDEDRRNRDDKVTSLCCNLIDWKTSEPTCFRMYFDRND